MPLPSVTLTIKKNGLAQVPASRASASVTLGICSDGIVGQFYSFGSDSGTSTAQLGQGPLIENVAEKQLVAGQAMAIPLAPTAAVTPFSAIDVTGVTGAATVAASSAPAKTIDIKIHTAGALGTMKFQYRLNGGAYSAPITSTASAYSVLIPATLTTLTFAAQTYTATDVWTVSTTGVITVVGAGTAGWVTQVTSPLDTYDVRVTVVKAGALGTGVFTYSVDGANNTSGEVLIPSGGKYAIPDTGIVLTFSGTFVLADVYKFTTATATFGNSDVTTAITALLALPYEWRFIHVVGMGANAAAAASLASAVDTLMTTAETNFRYVFTVIECPTNGSPGGSTESDTQVATAFTGFTSDRMMVCAGDVQHQSAINSRRFRRNVAVAATARIASKALSVSPAEVGDPAEPLPRVKSLYRDEQATGGALDSQRFTTATSIVGEDSGYFITRGNMMAASGTDFSSVMNRSVVDEGCRLGRKALLPYMNAKVRVDKKTGFIDERSAVKIERKVRYKIATGLGDDAVDVVVAVKRDEPILSTKRMPVDIGIIPFGYSEFIPATIGLVNPAVEVG